MLEWIAVITMFIDHVGYKFFPDDLTWRMFGRLAFPIYTYLVVRGLNFTKNKVNYFKRLIFLALLSQVPFMLLFEVNSLNVIFTLMYSAFAIIVYEKVNRKLWGIIILNCMAIIMIPVNDYMDYGLYGYILFLLYYFLNKNAYLLMAGHIFLNVLYSNYYFGSWYSIQSFSILATLLIILKAHLPNIKISRLFYRSFYPTHLIILYIIYGLN